MNSDYGKLQLRMKRSHKLPVLPVNVVRLINAIDHGEASALDLEKIIASDSSIAAKVLSATNFMAPQLAQSPHSTLRSAILVVGQRAIRSIATSLMMTHFVGARNEEHTEQLGRVSRHCLATGLLSRYVFARMQRDEPFESELQADELFAAGVLHDLGLGLLSVLDPESFERTYFLAEKMSSTLDVAFRRLFEGELTGLSIAAFEGYSLPALYTGILESMWQPWKNKAEFKTVCAVSYAHWLAGELGFRAEFWECHAELEPEVQVTVSLSEEEIALLQPALEQQVKSYLSTAA